MLLATSARVQDPVITMPAPAASGRARNGGSLPLLLQKCKAKKNFMCFAGFIRILPLYFGVNTANFELTVGNSSD